MKKINLIFSLLLIAGSLLSQELFLDRYAKIRDTDEDDSFQVSRMNLKDIKKAIKSSDETENVRFGKKLKTAMIGGDNSAPDREDFEALMKQYEELLAYNLDDLNIFILGKTYKNKIKELITIVDMGEANSIFDFEFKKAVGMDDCMSIIGDMKVNNISLREMMNGVVPDITATNQEALENNSIVEIDEMKGVQSDQTNEMIIPAIYDDIDVLCCVNKQEFFLLTKGDKVGLANISGKIFIPVEYDHITAANVETGVDYIHLIKGGKEGLADPNGRIIVPAIYDKITAFDVPGFLKITKNGKEGLINKLGSVVFKPKYEELNAHEENQVGVVNKKGKVSFYSMKKK